MQTDPTPGKFNFPVMNEKFAYVSSNPPMFTDKQGGNFKVTAEQVEKAKVMINTEIKKVITSMKKDRHIDDPEYKEKLEFTMKIAHAYEKLSEKEKYIVASEALRNYPLMEQLANSIHLKDIIDRKGLRIANYSPELFEYLAELVGKTMKNPFRELGDDEAGFVDITSRKRIMPNNEVQQAIRSNGKRKSNYVFTEPFLPKKRKIKGRSLPPPRINTSVPIIAGPRVRKTKITHPMGIPTRRSKRQI